MPRQITPHSFIMRGYYGKITYTLMMAENGLLFENTQRLPYSHDDFGIKYPCN